MRKYHVLTIVEKQNETPDSVWLSLAVPEDIVDEFAFLPGQHLPGWHPRGTELSPRTSQMVLLTQ